MDGSGHGHARDGSNSHIFNLPEVFARANFQTTQGSFVVPSAYCVFQSKASFSWRVGEVDNLAVSVYVIADLDSEEGLGLAKESLKFMVFEVYFHINS